MNFFFFKHIWNVSWSFACSCPLRVGCVSNSKHLFGDGTPRTIVYCALKKKSSLGGYEYRLIPNNTGKIDLMVIYRQQVVHCPCRSLVLRIYAFASMTAALLVSFPKPSEVILTLILHFPFRICSAILVTWCIPSGTRTTRAEVGLTVMRKLQFWRR